MLVQREDRLHLAPGQRGVGEVAVEEARAEVPVQQVAQLRLVQQVEHQGHVCHGHQVDEGPGEVGLQDVEGPAQVGRVARGTAVLPCLHPHRGVTDVRASVVMPDDDGHHLPVLLEVDPGVGLDGPDEPPGLAGQVEGGGPRHREVVALGLPRAHPGAGLRRAHQPGVELLQDVGQGDELPPGALGTLLH